MAEHPESYYEFLHDAELQEMSEDVSCSELRSGTGICRVDSSTSMSTVQTQSDVYDAEEKHKQEET